MDVYVFGAGASVEYHLPVLGDLLRYALVDWCTDLSRLNGFEKDLQILAAALDRDYGTELVSSRENHAEFQEQIVKIAALNVEEVLATFYEAENERSQQCQQ